MYIVRVRDFDFIQNPPPVVTPGLKGPAAPVVKLQRSQSNFATTGFTECIDMVTTRAQSTAAPSERRSLSVSSETSDGGVHGPGYSSDTSVTHVATAADAAAADLDAVGEHIQATYERIWHTLRLRTTTTRSATGQGWHTRFHDTDEEEQSVEYGGAAQAAVPMDEEMTEMTNVPNDTGETSDDDAMSELTELPEDVKSVAEWSEPKDADDVPAADSAISPEEAADGAQRTLAPAPTTAQAAAPAPVCVPENSTLRLRSLSATPSQVNDMAWRMCNLVNPWSAWQEPADSPVWDPFRENNVLEFDSHGRIQRITPRDVLEGDRNMAEAGNGQDTGDDDIRIPRGQLEEALNEFAARRVRDMLGDLYMEQMLQHRMLEAQQEYEEYRAHRLANNLPSLGQFSFQDLGRPFGGGARRGPVDGRGSQGSVGGSASQNPLAQGGRHFFHGMPLDANPRADVLMGNAAAGPSNGAGTIERERQLGRYQTPQNLFNVPTPAAPARFRGLQRQNQATPSEFAFWGATPTRPKQKLGPHGTELLDDVKEL